MNDAEWNNEDGRNPTGGGGCAIKQDRQISRRDFVQSVVTGGMAVGLGVPSWAAETTAGQMIYRTLGRTGEKVSALGLGGAHIGRPLDESEAVALTRSAINQGISAI